MSGITRVGKIGAVAALVVAAVAGSAMGASAATTLGPAAGGQVLSPGQTGTIMTGTVRSTTTAGTSDGAKLDFFAPAGTTFPSADVTYVKRNNGVRVESGNAALCTLVSSTQISCDWSAVRLINAPQAGGEGGVPDQYYILPIQVSSTAAFNTRFDGRMVVTRTSTDAPTELSVTSGESTFEFSTPAQADSPVIDPVVGGVASAGVLGLGALGLAMTRRNRAASSARV